MSFVNIQYNLYRILITKIKGTGSSSPNINEISFKDQSNNILTDLTVTSSSNDGTNVISRVTDGSGLTYWSPGTGRYTNGIPNGSSATSYTNIRKTISGEYIDISRASQFDLREIRITSSTNSPNSRPDNITVLGSVSGLVWYVHHIFTDLSYNNNVSVNNLYDVNYYSYYRFIGARLAGQRALLQIHELQLFGTEPNKTNNVEYPPINLSGGQAAQFNIPQYTLSGQAYGNGVYNLAASSVGYDLWPTNVFDGTGFSYASAESLNCYSNTTDDVGGSWPTLNGITSVSQMSISGEWCQIQLPTPIKLKEIYYSFSVASGGGWPQSFVIAGSNNGTTWNLVRFFNRLPGNNNQLLLTNFPSPPLNINISSGYHKADISFGSISGTTGYKILYGLSGSFDLSASIISTNTTIKGLSETNWYNFKVLSESSTSILSESDISNAQIYYSYIPTSPLIIDSFKQFRINMLTIIESYNFSTIRIKYLNETTAVLMGNSYDNAVIYDMSGSLKFTISGMSHFSYTLIYQNGSPILGFVQDNITTGGYEIGTDMVIDASNIYLMIQSGTDLSFSVINSTGGLINRVHQDSSSNDVHVLKYDLSGNLKWKTRVGGTATSSQQGRAICTFAEKVYINIRYPKNATTYVYDPSNNIRFSISGDTLYESTALIHLDENGIPKWVVKSHKVNGITNSVTTDGSFIYVTGDLLSNAQFYSSNGIQFSYNMTSAGAYIMQVNTNGIIKWITKMSGMYTSGIKVYNNNLYITGYSNIRTIALYYASNSSQFISQYSYAASSNYGVIIKYTVSGEPLWIALNESINYKSAIGDLAVNGNGIYAIGTFQHELTMYDSSATIVKTYSISGDNNVIMKYDLNGKYQYSNITTSNIISGQSGTNFNSIDVYNNKVLYGVYSVSGAVYNTYDISQLSINNYAVHYIEHRDLSSVLTASLTPIITSSIISIKTITISWQTLTNISGYRLYYGVNNYTNVINLSSGVTSYTFSDLSSNSTYIFTLVTYNNYGDSLPSNKLELFVPLINIDWVNWIDSSGIDYGRDIVTDLSGNIYITGDINRGIITINGQLYTKPSNASNSGVYIIKYNTTGAFQWIQWIDGSGNDQGMSIASDSLGNVYCTGIVQTGTVTISGITYTKPSNAADQGVYIVKYNTNGYLQLVQWIDGTSFDAGLGISTDLNGNVYCTGFVNTGTVTISGISYTKPYTLGDNGTYIVKYNTNGYLLWVQWVDGTGSDQGLSIASDGSGNVYCTGYVSTGSVTISGISYTKPSNETDQGAYIIKYNTNGYLQWVQWIDGSGADQGKGISTDLYGNIYCTGILSSNSVTISGQLYTKPYTLGDNGTYIIKYNTDGYLQWLKFIDGSGSEEGSSITTDSSGYVYSIGYATSNTITIDNYEYKKPINQTNDGVYIVKFDNNGELIWLSWVSGYYPYGYKIISDLTKNIYIIGINDSESLNIDNKIYYKPTNELNYSTFIIKLNDYAPSKPSIISAVGGVKKATITLQKAEGATTHFLKYKKASAPNFTTIQIE